ncbi:metallophosphoesterase family protein [Reyranella sp. CPCC 100927]|uniref:metallophosphoesterase family protein n=1 Tax=Reyranella sp. CPCC 100927 TaxID=2599616 RepID=UPI0011B72ED6|nr:metallophosphoesterase family protein [Reyranella sp. CPCC 100927]TWT08723.1 serine/threonine protein phosphatase [Reyranella sp. CPCC 100927]
MLGWFNKSRPSVARVPDGTRLYAVGDIHGRDDLLDQLLQAIGRDAQSARDDARRVLLFLGDYVDRGLGSRQVIERLLRRPLEEFETIHLLGNHEEAFLGFLAGTPIAFDWFKYGGLETLYSYDVPIPRRPSGPSEMEALRRQAVEAVPAAHVAFLQDCKLWHVEGDYAFAHAGVRPGVPLERQQADDLLWIRDAFLSSRANHGKVIVHGHTICERPEIRPNRINIDTGAYASGRLTCLVLEGVERRFLHT